MKRTSFFCLCLCICLLFSACGTHVPEESSVPAESVSSVPVVEDETAKTVRAYLEELLTKNTAEWLTAERAETIRETVKQLKAPILTEGDVLRIAERALSFYFSVWREGSAVSLPACGVMAAFGQGGGALPDTYGYGYTEAVAYTVYLFTPPEYVFRASDVGRVISPDAPPSWPGFYLALAEAGNTPLEAIETLSHGVKGVALLLSKLADGESPLDFRYCEGLSLLRANGEKSPLALLDLALSGEVSLPEAIFDYAAKHAESWIHSFSSGSFQWYCDYCRATGEAFEQVQIATNGEWIRVQTLLSPEAVCQVRKLVRLLPEPILTKEEVSGMVTGLHGPDEYISPILLSGIDGGKDLLLPARGDDTVKNYRLLTYLLDLFTPPDCRSADLFGQPGTYYALAGEKPCYALVIEGQGVTFVDGEGLPE